MVTLHTTVFNFQNFYVLPTQCVYVFCVDFGTNSDYFLIQHELTNFYNRDGDCLLRGTNWVFKCNSDLPLGGVNAMGNVVRDTTLTLIVSVWVQFEW
jgi:hypothetical protein